MAFSFTMSVLYRWSCEEQKNVRRAVTASQRRDFIACAVPTQNSAHCPPRLQGEGAVLPWWVPLGPTWVPVTFCQPWKGPQWGSRKRRRKPPELRGTGGFNLALENNCFIEFEGTHLLFVRNVLCSQPQHRAVALGSHLQSLPSRYLCPSGSSTPSVSLPPPVCRPPFRFGPTLPGQAFCISWAKPAPPLFSPGVS